MKIAINLRQYYKGKIGGMENYVRNVIEGLTSDDLTIFIHENEVEHGREFAPHARFVPLKHETALTAIEAELNHTRFDLFFCPLLVLEPLRVKIPSAIMMPDVQHEFFPEFFEPQVLQWRKQNYRPSAIDADIVFTLSSHAKQTIVERYGIEPDKIEAVYLDVDREFRQPASGEPSAGFRALSLPKDYLYFPANYWPHKNHSNVLKAMRILVRGKYPHLALVLTGAPGEGEDRVRKEAAQLGLKKNVHFAGYQSRKVVTEIYRGARALVFATKFEGFGIPVLEAFHTGTPVVTSNSGSSAEVARDAAILVNELDPARIADGIVQALEDRDLCLRNVEAGRRRAAEFSWQRAVEQTKAAFARITSPSYTIPRRVEVIEHPVVGIVTPSYNMAKYLEETIQSVLSQDYPHLDYVVIDGGSTDGTAHILEKYKGRLRYCMEKDKGQSDAINKGYHATRGELFTFLNADDYYLPGAVGKAVKHYLANPGVGMIYGEAYHVREDGSTIDRYPTQPFDFQKLSMQCYICQPAAFMAREAFVNAGMVNVTMNIALDYELWIRIAKQYPVLKVDDYLAASRMYSDNKTLSNRRRVYMEIFSTVKTHYGYVPYEWVNGYACYLLDRKDQFFDRSQPGMASYALSLLLGTYYNSGQRKRYWGEWARMTGFGGKFTNRWDDGWISSQYTEEFAIGGDAVSLCVSGKHWAPIKDGLLLTIKIDGRLAGKHKLTAGGPFQFQVECPASARGKLAKLTIECDKTWRPAANGDYRQLSCVIDSIRFENGKTAVA
jgi:glycosyltransferase involved in cell wall biosynthesis